MSHPSIDTLDPPAVKDLLDRGKLLLVDVREPNELAVERMAGAVLSPLSTFGATTLPHDGTRRVVFHCGSGKRSLTAAERRLAAGSDRTAHMGGSLAAWKCAGLPVISSPTTADAATERG